VRAGYAYIRADHWNRQRLHALRNRLHQPDELTSTNARGASGIATAQGSGTHPTKDIVMTRQPFIGTSLFILVSSIVVTGCVDGEEEGDGIDDSFIGNGKADAFGIAEGSPDAVAVLTMLRSATLQQLDDDAGLASNAAKAIVHHRQGGDRKDGTADDDSIDSLEELDSIPYVGPMSFRLLLDYARATVPLPSGDPFDDTFCGQDVGLTMGQIRGAIPEGSDSIGITTTLAGVRVRSRTCVTPDNCPAWVAGSPAYMFQLDGSPEPTDIPIPAMGIESQMAVAIAADGRPVLMYGGPVNVANTSRVLSLQCYPAAPITDDNAGVTLAGCELTLDDKVLNVRGTEDGSTTLLGSHCSQMIVRRADNVGATHSEFVFFARY